MSRPLEKQTVGELRKAAVRNKNRVCGNPSQMNKTSSVGSRDANSSSYGLKPSPAMKVYKRVTMSLAAVVASSVS